MSPHPSIYQHTPTGSFYQRSSSSSAGSVHQDAPLGRRKKQAPEGPQAGVGDKKGKKKALADARGGSSSTHDMGKDPLEIAYGPTVGTHPEITTDDFKVDAESGLHRPHAEPARQGRRNAPPAEEDGPAEEAAREREEAREGSGTDHSTNPHYGGLDGEDEFRNVWGR